MHVSDNFGARNPKKPEHPDLLLQVTGRRHSRRTPAVRSDNQFFEAGAKVGDARLRL